MGWRDDPVVSPAPAVKRSWRDDPVVQPAAGTPLPMGNSGLKVDASGNRSLDTGFLTGMPGVTPPASPTAPEGGAGRQLGLGARAVVQSGLGVGQLAYDAAGLLTNAGIGGLNMLGADLPYVKPYRENAATLMDAIGAPVPVTSNEKMMSAGVEGASQALGGYGLGSVMSQASQPIVAGVGQMLATAPKANVALGAAGAAAGEGVMQATDNPWLAGAADIATNLGGAGLAAGTRGLFRGGETGRKTVAEAVDDFGSFGSTPTVGQATKRPFWQGMESLLMKAPGGGRVKDAIIKSADAAAEKIRAIVSGTSTADAGGDLMRGIRAAGENYANRGADLFDEAYAQVQETARRSLRRADLSRTQALLDDLRGKLARSPEAAGGAVSPAVQRIEAIMADLGDPSTKGVGSTRFGFEDLRAVRTALGEDLKKQGGLMGFSGSQETPLRALYGALTEDMNGYASKWGAGKSLGIANRYWRMANNRTNGWLGTLGKIDDPQKFFDAARRADASTLKVLLRTVSPDDRVSYARGLLGDLGRATSGNQNAAGDAWSFDTLLTNVDKMGPEARKIVFGRLKGVGNLDEQIDQIARAAGGVRASGRVLANNSGTAANTIGITAGVLFLDALRRGDWGTAKALAGGTAIVNGAARLMTSPNFVKFLADTTRQPVERLPALISRLGQLAKHEPDIAPELQDLVEGVRSPE